MACLYAPETAARGVVAPWLFDVVGIGSRGDIFAGYLAAAVLMAVATLVATR
ncbi:MAG: hypothetical protein ACRD01_03930 [Terriglobales bacterium]